MTSCKQQLPPFSVRLQIFVSRLPVSFRLVVRSTADELVHRQRINGCLRFHRDLVQNAFIYAEKAPVVIRWHQRISIRCIFISEYLRILQAAGAQLLFSPTVLDDSPVRLNDQRWRHAVSQAAQRQMGHDVQAACNSCQQEISAIRAAYNEVKHPSAFHIKPFKTCDAHGSSLSGRGFQARFNHRDGRPYRHVVL